MMTSGEPKDHRRPLTVDMIVYEDEDEGGWIAETRTKPFMLSTGRSRLLAVAKLTEVVKDYMKRQGNFKITFVEVDDDR